MNVPAGNNLPPLYVDPQPVTATRHGASRLRRQGFGYASKLNAILLTAEEFPVAAGFYPVVFAQDGSPLAIMGLRRDVNAMVDAEGRWKAGTYVPAYLRRYPFILAASGEQQVLCVDEASGLLSVVEGEPLFVDGKPSAETQKALQFCVAFNQQVEATRAFAAELTKQGLLAPNRANVTLPNGEQLSFAGFQVIDRAKFDALPDKVFLNWRKKGWLQLAYTHFTSLPRLQNLVEATAAHGRKAA